MAETKAEEALVTPPSEATPRDAQTLFDEAMEFCQASKKYWSQGDLESALSALDQAYGLILQADTNNDPALQQQQEDLRLTIGKRIVEIHASRQTTVAGRHDAIPREVNLHVELMIAQFKGSERRFFLESYKRSGRFRPLIRKALEKAGLPEELSWLPFIESGFKLRALSPARALGLWQFIPSTGQRFGLVRDQWVDERLDPEKSTAAAIAYLQELHGIFGDWLTVLAAYNCGEGRVLGVIRGQQVNYLDNFWDLYERLPRETASYVPRFLAVLAILSDPAKYGFELPEPEPEIAFETVTVAKQMRLIDIAKALEVPEQDVLNLNAELRREATPAESHSLLVPKGSAAKLGEKIAGIPVFTPPPRLFTFHRVRSGETLSHIADRYGTSVQALVKLNRIRNVHALQIGQSLRVPIGRRLVSPPSPSLPPKPVETKPNGIIPPAGTVPYQVKPGDTPFQIAQDHGMNLDRFLQLNRLSPRSRIFPGQTLLVEGGTSSITP